MFLSLLVLLANMTLMGVVDTTFARVNMGAFALEELAAFPDIKVVRHTVPGIKDLPVECKRLFEQGAEVCIAMGMVGRQPLDKQCAHEASLAIQAVQLLTNKHILEVFVHEEEGKDEEDLYSIFEQRSRKHAQNAARLVLEPQWFVENAGQGLRQGQEDVGGLRL